MKSKVKQNKTSPKRNETYETYCICNNAILTDKEERNKKKHNEEVKKHVIDEIRQANDVKSL